MTARKSFLKPRKDNRYREHVLGINRKCATTMELKSVSSEDKGICNLRSGEHFLPFSRPPTLSLPQFRAPRKKERLLRDTRCSVRDKKTSKAQPQKLTIEKCIVNLLVNRRLQQKVNHIPRTARQRFKARECLVNSSCFPRQKTEIQRAL